MKNLIVAREKEQAVFERLVSEPTARCTCTRLRWPKRKPICTAGV